MLPTLPKLLSIATVLTALAPAQPPAQPPQLSPQAAYDQVTRPLEITRRAIANWSASETTALALAIKQAADQCAARTPDQFTGDDLIAYARLCSLGQQWPTVSTAAARYIAAPAPKPQLAQAYAFQVDASLHTQDPKAALAACQAMLRAVPYDAFGDQAITEALHYLQLAFTPDALTLYADRQPFLLAGLRAARLPAAATAQPASSPIQTTAIPIHTLYANGLAYAALQQFTGNPAEAAVTVAALDAALAEASTSLPPDEALPIADTRRQYALLGKPLPVIPLALSLYAANETPRINRNYGAATVLLLFPDWCAQCVRMAQAILPTLFRVSEANVHLYALLAQPTPPAVAPTNAKSKLPLKAPAESGPDPAPTDPAPTRTAADQLRGTPTLIVPPATLTQFAATDFPLLIATDPKGIVRFLQPAPENALNPGDFLDQVTSHIARQWPRNPPAAPPAAPASAPTSAQP